MISEDRAHSLAFQVLAYLTSTGPRPNLDALDFWEAKLVGQHLGTLSGRSVALVVDELNGRVGFVFLDEVLPKTEDPDLEAALERWAAKEDGDDEEGER